MFDNLFENRNKTVSDLIKLGDYLGRSLRENVSIFKIDAEEQTVCYVSESNKVIAGTFETEDRLALHDIVVEDVEVFLNQNKFDSLVDTKISSFVKNIYEDSHKKAKSSFDDLLYLWESRLKFKAIKKKLEEKTLRFDETSKIINTEEFQKFLEIAPQLVQYLQQHKEKISKVSEIKTAVRLSQTIAEAFDIVKHDYDSLAEEGSFVVLEETTKSVYEMVCRHELVKKELLEHRANFDTVWASSSKVQSLAGLLYSDDSVIAEALSAAVKEVPYLALASKKQLTETFKNALNLNNVKDINLSDIQKFSSFIFEMKKPIKRELISHLNERYGINVQNLKEPATFKGLLNTQISIFETLAKISPKKSVQKTVLMDLAESLKTKNGVESIDCNEVIQEVFIAAGYDELVINESLGSYLDFNKIATDLTKVSDILKMISGAAGGAGGGDAAAAAQAMQTTSQMGTAPQQKMPQTSPPPPTGMDDDDVNVPQGDDGMEGEEGMEPEGMEGQEGMEGEDMEDLQPEAPPEEVDVPDDKYMKVMSDLEDIIASLKSELGSGDEMPEDMEGEEEGEEEEEGMEDDEEGIDAEQAELDAEEDAIEAKHEKAHEIEDEAEEEEDTVRAKKKSTEKKEDKLKRMK